MIREGNSHSEVSSFGRICMISQLIFYSIFSVLAYNPLVYRKVKRLRALYRCNIKKNTAEVIVTNIS